MRLLLVVLGFLYLVSACKTQSGSESALDTVDIPQTAVRNQYRIGFCWAYATAAMVESYKKTQGETMDLSEEAIGFWRIVEELLYVSKTKALRDMILDAPAVDMRLIYKVYVEGLQGGEVVYTDDLPGKERTLSGFDLLEKYGAWPESAWSEKIFDSNALIIGINNRFKSLLHKNPENCCSIESILSEVMLAPASDPDSGFKSAPPAQFQLAGTTTTPTQFWKSLNFDISKFKPVAIEADASKFDRSLQWIKKSLALGYSVPIEFPVDKSNYANGSFKIEPGHKLDESKFSGHVVLISDWVNRGGRPGAVSPEELTAALNAGTDQLDYFVFKNSWGPSSIVGAEFSAIPSGFGLLYRDYLEQAAATQSVIRQPGLLFVVLPKEVLN